MADTPSPALKLSGQVEPDLIAYRRVSGWAIVGLAFGVASAVVLIWPVLWPVSVFGAVASALALHFIGSAGGVLIGRRAAVGGLALSLMFLASAPTQILTTRWWLIRESDAMASEWFSYLLHGQPALAEWYTQSPATRSPFDSEHALRKYYSTRPSLRKSLETFVANALARTLLELDGKAQVRLYLNENVKQGDAHDVVTSVYAVTLGDGATKRSFFVRVVLDRTEDPTTGRPRWQVRDYVAPVKPGVPLEQQSAQES